MREDRKALKRIETDMPNSLGLSLLLDSYNKEAVWKDKQGQHSINLVTGEGSIKSRITMDQNGELTEQISIPFNLMAVNTKEASVLGVNISIEGQSSNSGFSPRIGIGLGGGIGMGGGMGVGLGTGMRLWVSLRTRRPECRYKTCSPTRKSQFQLSGPK